MTKEEKKEYKQKIIDLLQSDNESSWEQALELNKTLDILSKRELQKYHQTYYLTIHVKALESIIRKRKTTSAGDDIYDYLYFARIEYDSNLEIQKRIRKALRDYEKLD